MKFFSNEEFDKMFREIVGAEFICYDTLLYVSQRMLFGSVCKWCYNDPALRGKQYEEDIMQEIQIRLIKNCVTGFFLRNNEPNYDPEGFKNWIFTLAINVKNDFAKKVRRIQFIEVKELDGESEQSYQEEMFSSDESFERLNNAFRIVIESDSKVYKVLTWVAQLIIILNSNVTKIESNDILIEQFDSMTLDAMFALVVEQATAIPWLQLERSQILTIKARLDEECSDGCRMGEKVYSDFYMKKGAKASISDWVNRMNNHVVKEEKNNDTSYS